MTDLLDLGFPTGVPKSQLAELLQEKYPTHKFEKVFLLKGRFAQQKRLENAVTSLFPVCISIVLKHTNRPSVLRTRRS